MSTGEILYAVLLGVILVWVADIFHLWEPWARALTRLWDGFRGRNRGAS